MIRTAREGESPRRAIRERRSAPLAHRADSILPARARCELPGAGRRPGRGASRARARGLRRRGRPGRGDRHLRLRPAHLPRQGRDRARLRDRPRVRGHRDRRRRRRQRGRGGRSGPRHLLHGVRRAAFTAGAASTTSATRGGCSATARRSARFRARRPSWSLVPSANLTLRRVPEGLSDEVALFAGDVAGTGYHAVCGDAARPEPLEPGASVAVLGLGPGRAERRPGGACVRRVVGGRRRHGRGAAANGRVVRRRTASISPRTTCGPG